MLKIRRKVLHDGTEKVRTLYRVHCKWGTHSGCIVFLFDKPEEGVRTTAIKVDDENNVRYGRQYSVVIDRIREDGFVFLSMG